MKKREAWLIIVIAVCILFLIFIAKAGFFNQIDRVLYTGKAGDYCTPSCTCASTTCVGSTCSNGCTGTCAGTKQPSCSSASDVNCGAAITSTNECSGCTGTGTKCSTGYTCTSGVCVADSSSSTNPPASSCTPSCAGKQCGDNGCGGSCGNCLSTEICSKSKCIIPQCSDKKDNDADGFIDDKDNGCWKDISDSSTYDAKDNNEAIANAGDAETPEIIDESVSETETPSSSSKDETSAGVFGTISEISTNKIMLISAGALLIIIISGSIIYILHKSNKNSFKKKPAKKKKKKR